MEFVRSLRHSDPGYDELMIVPGGLDVEIRRASIKLALDRGSRWFLSIPLIPLEVEEQGNNYLDHLQKVLKVLVFQDIAPYSDLNLSPSRKKALRRRGRMPE